MYGTRYGELVDWQAGPTHRADITAFLSACLILEGQTYLMGALRKIADRILEGADLSKPATPEEWKLMTKLTYYGGGVHTNQAFTRFLYR